MSLHRFGAKRDTSEPEVVAEWESLGAVSESFAKKGWPDRVVFHDGHTYWADVKSARGGLTSEQVKTFTRLYALGVRVYLPRNKADARAMLQRTLQPWSPSQGQVAAEAERERLRMAQRAASAARKHRPGYSRARTVAELCKEDGCGKSRSDGSIYCLKHGGKS